MALPSKVENSLPSMKHRQSTYFLLFMMIAFVTSSIPASSLAANVAPKKDKVAYTSRVTEKLIENWSLPVWLARQNLSAKVLIFLDAEGNVIKTNFVETSGNAQFDSAADSAIKQSSPFPPPSARIAPDLESSGIKVNFPLETEEVKISSEQIDAEYSAILKTNKCEKEYWSRYKLAEYFQSAANEGKITPYDAAWGDAHTKRNVPTARLLFMVSNLMEYLPDMPDAIKAKFDQEFSAEVEKARNKKAVFNISIKRDYECYKKLK